MSTEDTPARPEPASVGAELRAMEAAHRELAELDYATQDRILYWLNQRLRWGRPDSDGAPF